MKEKKFYSSLFFVLFTFMLFGEASAEVTRLCEVSFFARGGWTYPALAEVTFASGTELNRRQNTNAFDYQENYAIVPGQYGPLYMELNRTIFADTRSGFGPSAFKQLFSAQPQVQATQMGAYKRKAKCVITAVDARR